MLVEEKDEEETVKEALPCCKCSYLLNFAAAYLKCKPAHLGKNGRALLERLQLQPSDTPLPLSQIVPPGTSPAERRREVVKITHSITTLEKNGLVTTALVPTIIYQKDAKPEIRNTLWAWPTALGRAAPGFLPGRKGVYKNYLTDRIIEMAAAKTTNNPNTLFSLYTIYLGWLLSVTKPILALVDPRTQRSSRGREQTLLCARASEQLYRLLPEQHKPHGDKAPDSAESGANPSL